MSEATQHNSGWQNPVAPLLWALQGTKTSTLCKNIYEEEMQSHQVRFDQEPMGRLRMRIWQAAVHVMIFFSLF